MIAAELRGGNKPSLNEALGWIGSRVDDIYGANVGRLEDVWIDPGTGAPRWLLVKEGRFGGRTTLIPFEDATAGAGHVWVPYEREIVREAPEIEPGAPLTQQVEAALRSHYAANVPSAIAHAGSGAGSPTPPQPAPAPQQQQRQPVDPAEPPATTATLRFATGGTQSAPPPSFAAPQSAPAAEDPQRTEYRPPAPTPRRPVLREQPTPPQQSAPPQGAQPQGMPPGLPPRPAPPIAAPPAQQQPNPYGYPQQQAPPPQQPPPGYAYPPQGYQQPQPYPPAPRPAPPQGWPQPPQGWPQPPEPVWRQPLPPPPPAPQPNPIEMLNSLADSSQVHYVEIELSGELSIRGELRSVRVIPRDHGPGYGG